MFVDFLAGYVGLFRLCSLFNVEWLLIVEDVV